MIGEITGCYSGATSTAVVETRGGDAYYSGATSTAVVETRGGDASWWTSFVVLACVFFCTSGGVSIFRVPLQMFSSAIDR